MSQQFRQILESHPAPSLRRYIRASNVKGYSKLKKEELIMWMMTHADRFAHIPLYVTPPKRQRVRKAPRALTMIPMRSLTPMQLITQKSMSTKRRRNLANLAIPTMDDDQL